MAFSPAQDLDLIADAAIEAGKVALGYFQSENEVWMKAGNSPVSEADHAVNNHLVKVLRKARSEYAWMSEETLDDDTRLQNDTVFIVDPIDGTRGFINGSAEWCISVAVINKGEPVAGVLVCPALDQVWTASKGDGAQMNGELIKSPAICDVQKVTGSRKLIEVMSASSLALSVTDFVPSLALRLARVASGELDAAFSRPGAHEWDIAASDIILREAGATLVDMEGQMQVYNKRKLGSPSMVACSLTAQKNVISLAKSAGFLH